MSIYSWGLTGSHRGRDTEIAGTCDMNSHDVLDVRGAIKSILEIPGVNYACRGNVLTLDVIKLIVTIAPL